MNTRRLAIRVLIGLPIVLVLAWFAGAHSDQAVDLHLGLFTLHDVSLAVALFAAVIVGMLVILIAGLRGDRAAVGELRGGTRRPVEGGETE